MARVNGLPREQPPASEPRRRSATSVSSRSATARCAATRPGMRQRVKLAQALVHDPKLMLLDEPTNGLDPAGRDEMLDLVRRIGSEFGISILMSLAPAHRDRAGLRLPRRDRGRAADPLGLARDVHRSHRDADRGGRGDGDERPRRAPPASADTTPEVGRRASSRSTSARRSPRYDAIRDGAASLGLGLIRIEQRASTSRISSATSRRRTRRADPCLRTRAARLASGNIYDLGYRHYDGRPRRASRHAADALRPRPARLLRARPPGDEPRSSPGHSRSSPSSRRSSSSASARFSAASTRTSRSTSTRTTSPTCASSSSSSAPPSLRSSSARTSATGRSRSTSPGPSPVRLHAREVRRAHERRCSS